MKKIIERLRTRTSAMAHDLLTIPLAWLGAFWLRFNLDTIPPAYLDAALAALPLVVLVQGVMFWVFGLYRGVWRFASLPDLVRIGQAVLWGALCISLALFAWTRLEDIPRSVPPLFLVFQLLLLAAPRLLYRLIKDRRLELTGGKRVLVVGAGRAGEMLVRDMRRDPSHAYCAVAFVDDKLRRQGSDIHGVPIKGSTALIPELTEELQIDLILLALPSATDSMMRRLVKLCERSGKPFRTVPQLESLMTGQVSINQLREVSIEDLLGRNPVKLDWNGIRSGLAGRTILITGAGGSIGSELCRQVISANPERLILVDNCELNLYRMEMELSERHPSLAFDHHLLDVGDRVAIDQLFESRRPQIVFHAAAYKHVPMLEGQARSAVRNNVLGTLTVATAAERAGAERFVLISTDKAVNPTNVMGATKRSAEVLCQALNQDSHTRFITVRFGNVLASAGSVVPLFKRQIAGGGPVTVTHPDIERYFMTIPEACQLIMQSAVIGDGGEVFVLDMGEPVPITFLAEQMIRLSGRTPGRDVAIDFVGLRPGEKLFEELFYAFEDLIPTEHPKIRVARHADKPLNEVSACIDGLRDAIGRCDDAHLREHLGRLVPEWQREGSANETINEPA